MKVKHLKAGLYLVNHQHVQFCKDSFFLGLCCFSCSLAELWPINHERDQGHLPSYFNIVGQIDLSNMGRRAKPWPACISLGNYSISGVSKWAKTDTKP